LIWAKIKVGENRAKAALEKLHSEFDKRMKAVDAAAANSEKPAQAPRPQAESTIPSTEEQYALLHNIWSSHDGVVNLLKNSNKAKHYDAYQTFRSILEEFNELFEDLPIIQSTPVSKE
jgi:hypothetical protein